MLTQSELNLLPYMLLRSTAIECLHLLKMRPLVPLEVEDKLTGYKGTILEFVFDPHRVPEVNEHYRVAGYHIPANMSVIAVTDDDSILAWGGTNSIYRFPKGGGDRQMAFQDLGGLIYDYGREIKNKKTEIDEMIALLRQTSGKAD